MDARLAQKNFDDIWSSSLWALARTTLVFFGATQDRDRAPLSVSLEASVVTFVNKTHRHLPKVHPDVSAGTSPELSWSREGDVEGVTSLALLPNWSAFGVKEDALSFCVVSLLFVPYTIAKPP